MIIRHKSSVNNLIHQLYRYMVFPFKFCACISFYFPKRWANFSPDLMCQCAPLWWDKQMLFLLLPDTKGHNVKCSAVCSIPADVNFVCTLFLNHGRWPHEKRLTTKFSSLFVVKISLCWYHINCNVKFGCYTLVSMPCTWIKLLNHGRVALTYDSNRHCPANQT